MIHFNISGSGTTSDKRLCDSCRFSQITQDSNGVESVRCASPYTGARGFDITRTVVKCNQYQDFSAMSLYDIHKIGWILEVKGKAVIGFKPPEEKR